MKYVLFIPIILLIVSCDSGRQSTQKVRSKDSLTIPEDIHTIVGIGRVEPEKGIVNLASEAGGIVQSVNKHAGDTVRKGAVILMLKQNDAKLKMQQLKDQILTQQRQMQSDQIVVNQYKAQLQNKTQTLATSEKLAQTGAETRENVASLKTEKKVLEVQLAQREKAVSIDRSKISTLQTQLKSAENTLREKTVRAPSDGILLSMDAKAGGAIEPLTSFATFAPKGPWVVHGEADEMFANRLAIGQQVSIRYIGNVNTITTGEIIYLSPDLSNKSLFTDAPGEKQDRRVRRFKVLLDSTGRLLLNSKVECNIHLKNESP